MPLGQVSGQRVDTIVDHATSECPRLPQPNKFCPRPCAFAEREDEAPLLALNLHYVVRPVEASDRGRDRCS